MFLKISQYSLKDPFTPVTFLKRDFDTVFFYENCEICKGLYFEKHLRIAASDVY